MTTQLRLAASCLLFLASSNANADLIHQWSFEDNLNDTSGSGNHGLVSGGDGIADYRAGQSGRAININSAEGIIDTTASNLPLGGSDAWTMNVWLNFDTAPAALSYVAGFGPKDGGHGQGTHRGLVNNQFIFWGHSRDLQASTGYDVDGTWHMYTVAYDGTNMRMYEDATLVGSGAVSLTNVPLAQVSVGNSSPWSSGFRGAVDEFSIWDEALDQTQIDALFGGTATVPEPSGCLMLGCIGFAGVLRAAAAAAAAARRAGHALSVCRSLHEHLVDRRHARTRCVESTESRFTRRAYVVTNQGKWLMLLSACGAGVGVASGKGLLALVGLSVLCWVLLEWMLFRWRVFTLTQALKVTRTINDGEPPSTLWMGRTVQVRFRIGLDGLAGSGRFLPFVQFHDFLPAGLETEDHANFVQAFVRSDMTHEYEMTPKAAGSFTMPGVCARISDLQGLFYAQRFFPVEHSFRVMPSPIQADSFPQMTKPHNSLMPPGIHRFLRAGAGPELLELREYVPGDPPKSIAWKVSARKDTLMTRQYESEVPARVTMFVDGSAGARVGLPGHRAVDSIVETAATVAKAVMTERDPVGLIQYGDSETSVLKHGNGERHLFRILDALANMSFRNNPDARLSQEAFDQAYSLCEDLYPHLLDPEINVVPFAFLPSRGLNDKRRALTDGFLRRLIRGISRIVFFWLLLGRFSKRRQNHRQRMQLGAVLSVLYELPADATVRLAYDEAVMARYVYRFLTDHGAPWTDAVYNSKGANIAATHGRLGTLADTITRAVALARDNEVFVLIADLIDHAGTLGRLRDAVRVARARNHRVVVICPWPAPVTSEKLAGLPDDIIEITRRAERYRLEEAAEQLRAEFRRLGIPFAMATEGKSVRLVLAEAGMAKDARTTRVGAV